VDSIQALRIVSRARRAGLIMSPAQVFEHPAIAALSRVVEVQESPSAEPVSVPDGRDQQQLARLRAEDANIEDAYPLTPAQEGMLYHALEAPDEGAYVQQLTFLIRGELRVDDLAAAWRHVVGRHAALRTAFPALDSGEALQVVYRQVDVPLREKDWRGVETAEQRARTEELLASEREQGFILSWAPLLRLTVIKLQADLHRLVWTYHHLLIDGWCLPILLEEVLLAYEHARAGKGLDASPSRPFRDYIAWLARRDQANEAVYWTRTLAGFSAPTPLGIDRGDAAAASGRADAFAERTLVIPSATTAALEALARAHQVTLNTVVQGAYALLISRYGGADDVVYGVTVSGRPAALAGVESMIGMFINTLPIRVAVHEDSALVPWLRELQARLVELREYEGSPLVRVHGASDVPRGRPLFESIFVFENYPMDGSLAARAGGLGIEDVRVLEQTHYPLTLMVFPGAELRLRAGFDTRRFDGDAIERMLGHLQTLLVGFAADPERRLADLPMVSPDEERNLLRLGTADGHDRATLDGLSEAELGSMLDLYLVGEEARDE
jgi:hypothetical protein